MPLPTSDVATSKFGTGSSEIDGYTQKLGSAAAPPRAGGVADPLAIQPIRTCYPAEFGRRYNGTSIIIKEIQLKI